MLPKAPVIIEAAATHTASLIFLHGLGDTGYGWASEMRDLSRKLDFIKVILPHAYDYESIQFPRFPNFYQTY